MAFKKPELEDIKDYMNEKQFYAIDEHEAFYDHFESNGWMVGKNKMKDWKAAVRTWIRNAKKWGRNNVQAQANKPSYESFADRQRREAAEAFQELERGNGEVGLRVVR